VNILTAIQNGSTTWREFINSMFEIIDQGIIVRGASFPTTGTSSKYFYNETTGFIYYDNGTSWIKIGGPSISVSVIGTTTFAVGDVIGINAGSHVLAQAGVTSAMSVCNSQSSPGGPLSHVSSGDALVSLESGITPVVGDIAFLSAASPGRATNIQPSTVVQPIGTFQSGATNGKAIVHLSISIFFITNK
jgi:hypothetical protein